MPLVRQLFVLLFALPLVRLWLGLTIRHQERLPQAGPAIVIANHNSHLDILTLFSLFPLGLIPRIRPAAAADYFFRNAALAWFSTRVIGIIGVQRGARKGDDPLAGCRAALARGEILILFPEGTRGEPEQLSSIKSGLWHLAGEFPQVPIIPVYMHGLGRTLGRGQWLPVPFFVDIAVGHPLHWGAERLKFLQQVQDCFADLQTKVQPSHHHSE